MDILEYAKFKKMTGGTGGSSDGSSTSGSTKAFIDVLELPTSNIKTGAFYRMPVGTFVFNGDVIKEYVCHCVNALPEVGDVVTDATMTALTAYYNTQDGEAYGYVTDAIGSGLGMSAGWYTLSELFAVVNTVPYGGIVTNMSECKDGLYLLVRYHIYFYKDGWCEAAFGYETVPVVIQWDGDMTGMDSVQLEEGVFLVKVSDKVYSAEDLIGAVVTFRDTSGSVTVNDITEVFMDDFPGAIVTDAPVVVVYNAEEMSSAIGVTVTNGTYFVSGSDMYTSSLSFKSTIAAIDPKFIPDKPDLSQYAKTSDVEALETQIGDISAALDELHTYAQSKVNGGEEA